MLVIILVVILVLALFGSFPTWPHSRGWGYYPSGGIGLVSLILLILFLMGRLYLYTGQFGGPNLSRNSSGVGRQRALVLPSLAKCVRLAKISLCRPCMSAAPEGTNGLIQPLEDRAVQFA